MVQNYNCLLGELWWFFCCGVYCWILLGCVIMVEKIKRNKYNCGMLEKIWYNKKRAENFYLGGVLRWLRQEI